MDRVINTAVLQLVHLVSPLPSIWSNLEAFMFHTEQDERQTKEVSHFKYVVKL